MPNRWEKMEEALVGVLVLFREARINDPYEDDMTPTERTMVADKRRRLLREAGEALTTVRNHLRKMMP